MTELKPCPFCGSEAKVHREPPKGVRVCCFKPYIECSCGLTLQKNSFTELIEGWNKRTEPKVERNLDSHGFSDYAELEYL